MKSKNQKLSLFAILTGFIIAILLLVIDGHAKGVTINNYISFVFLYPIILLIYYYLIKSLNTILYKVNQNLLLTTYSFTLLSITMLVIELCFFQGNNTGYNILLISTIIRHISRFLIMLCALEFDKISDNLSRYIKIAAQIAISLLFIVIISNIFIGHDILRYAFNIILIAIIGILLARLVLITDNADKRSFFVKLLSTFIIISVYNNEIYMYLLLQLLLITYIIHKDFSKKELGVSYEKD